MDRVATQATFGSKLRTAARSPNPPGMSAFGMWTKLADAAECLQRSTRAKEG